MANGLDSDVSTAGRCWIVDDEEPGRRELTLGIRDCLVVEDDNVIGSFPLVGNGNVGAALAERLDDLGCLRPSSASRVSQAGYISRSKTTANGVHLSGKEESPVSKIQPVPPSLLPGECVQSLGQNFEFNILTALGERPQFPSCGEPYSQHLCVPA